MIKESTLRALRDQVDIVLLVEESGVRLKGHGATKTGLCPFHNEKTGSFTVSSAKGMYKCFGCGKGGDAINFYMAIHKLDFYEAVEQLCQKGGIELQLDSKTSPEEWAERKNKEAEYRKILDYAEGFFFKSLMEQPADSQVWRDIFRRRYTREDAIEWRMGYAPDNARLHNTLTNQGWNVPSEELSLITITSGVSYDYYRNRLTLPIHDRNGRLLGFSGRAVGLADPNIPKYINPRSSGVYEKSSVLFGLHRAIQGINRCGFAYLVEGNFDVVTMHKHGLDNTVAPCGTALTEEQCRLLRKYTDHIVQLGDGDAAGVKAMLRNVDMLSAAGFRQDVCELPEGHDPDSYIRELATQLPINNQEHEEFIEFAA